MLRPTASRIHYSSLQRYYKVASNFNGDIFRLSRLRVVENSLKVLDNVAIDN